MPRRVTAAEAIHVLSVLAEHQINLTHVQEVMGCVPDVTRRPQKTCPLNDGTSCRVFGVTWWPPDDRFGGYEVCTAHEWAGGPDGPASRRLTVPFRTREPGKRARHGVALIPQADRVGWAVAEEQACIDYGCEVFSITREGMATAVAAWLGQLFLTYRPEATLITSPATVREETSKDERLATVGIEVKTTTVRSPVASYRDFIRMERLIGVLLGAAYVLCPGGVMVSRELRLEGSPVVLPDRIDDPELSAALTLASFIALGTLGSEEEDAGGR